MLRGEIWWADLPDPVKSVPGYRRPVLIIQADAFNKSKINTVICLIITSNLQLIRAPGNVLLKQSESKLPKDSVVNVSQIVTLDKSFLTGYVNTINRKVIKKIETGLHLVLEL